MTKSDFTYIAKHLSITDCRKLVVSLQNLNYALPSSISEAVKKVPKKVPCLQLLLAWNSEVSKGGGKGRSHVDVARRLRQLDKRHLADWLERSVFHQLAIDVHETLNSYPFKVKKVVKTTVTKYYKSNKVSTEGWTKYDTVLWTGIIAGVGFAFYQVVDRSCVNKRRRNNEKCELKDLLIRENFDSDDTGDDDYASENMFFNSIEHFDED
ncbi:uncharacterized protein LOC134652918 [Cydia amplana]|uniref:uncharacterized protein LOC134652918 n=1 Tax=Cydia amplana TaxID=1869771 RepID=UPI002FE547DA